MGSNCALRPSIKTSTTAGSSSSASQAARTFGRPKPDPAVVAAARAEEEARDKAARGTSIALRGLYGSRGDDHPPVLLVDGYNVAFHAAAGYASAPSGGGDASSDGVDLDGARQKLLLDMCEYGAVAGLRVVVAWDALANPAAKGLDRARVAGVDVVYCGDREADTLLVQEAARLVETGCPRVLVATSDREVQTGLDWTKVGFVPAGVLLKEMRRALAAADRAYKARAAVAKAAGPRLGGSLRGGQVDALRALKAKLMEEGKGGSCGVGGKKK